MSHISLPAPAFDSGPMEWPTEVEDNEVSFNHGVGFQPEYYLVQVLAVDQAGVVQGPAPFSWQITQHAMTLRRTDGQQTPLTVYVRIWLALPEKYGQAVASLNQTLDVLKRNPFS